MPSLRRGGATIHYERAGHGPLVLLTHGWGSSAADFVAAMAELATQRTVVAWDLPGHGGTNVPFVPEDFSPAATLDLFDALLDEMGAADAVLLGHSLGGYLSLRYRLARPQRVAGLVLVGTGPGFRDVEARTGWNRFVQSQAVHVEEQGRPDRQGWAFAARHLLPQHDSVVLDTLPSVDVPTLVVVGADDDRFLGSSRYLASKVPGAELALIDDGGHAPFQTKAHEFDVAVLDFLARRLPRDGAAVPSGKPEEALADGSTDGTG